MCCRKQHSQKAVAMHRRRTSFLWQQRKTLSTWLGYLISMKLVMECALRQSYTRLLMHIFGVWIKAARCMCLMRPGMQKSTRLGTRTNKGKKLNLRTGPHWPTAKTLLERYKLCQAKLKERKNEERSKPIKEDINTGGHVDKITQPHKT